MSTSSASLSVCAGKDFACIKIVGRANFSCSPDFKTLLTQLAQKGCKCYILELSECVLMDSTFLGVLAGAALKLRMSGPAGGLTLVRVGERNLEIIRNLGLHRLATVDSGNFDMSFHGSPPVALSAEKKSEIESAKLVLEAHEHLVDADSSNAAKFQDVLAFLRNRVESR